MQIQLPQTTNKAFKGFVCRRRSLKTFAEIFVPVKATTFHPNHRSWCQNVYSQRRVPRMLSRVIILLQNNTQMLNEIISMPTNINSSWHIDFIKNSNYSNYHHVCFLCYIHSYGASFNYPHLTRAWNLIFRKFNVVK